MDRWTNTARCRVACPRLKRQKRERERDGERERDRERERGRGRDGVVMAVYMHRRSRMANRTRFISDTAFDV